MNYFLFVCIKLLIFIYQSVKSASYSLSGKSSVFIIIDFDWRPALNATIFSSLNFLSTSPFTPSSWLKGGTPPGGTPKAKTSSSLHIAPFLPTFYNFFSLFQITLRLALYTKRRVFYFPLTSMVLAPHSKGVFLIIADSYEVLVGSCSIISN